MQATGSYFYKDLKNPFTTAKKLIKLALDSVKSKKTQKAPRGEIAVYCFVKVNSTPEGAYA